MEPHKKNRKGDTTMAKAKSKKVGGEKKAAPRKDAEAKAAKSAKTTKQDRKV